MKKTIVLISVLFMFINAIAQDCNLNEEAKRHWFKAGGMRKAIDNADDWQLVADEYEKAAQYAPDCPAIYYNLGICYEELGKNQPELCDTAIACYQKYLQLNPNAENKSEMDSLIYEIEGKKEIYQKQIEEESKKFLGIWIFHDNIGTKLDHPLLSMNIFLSEGKLQAQVAAFINADYQIARYQIIPVYVSRDFISIKFECKLWNNSIWRVECKKIQLSLNRLTTNKLYSNGDMTGNIYWDKQENTDEYYLKFL